MYSKLDYIEDHIQFEMTNSIANSSQEQGINMVFVLGGNGTHAGAHEVHKEVQKSCNFTNQVMYSCLINDLIISKY